MQYNTISNMQYHPIPNVQYHPIKYYNAIHWYKNTKYTTQYKMPYGNTRQYTAIQYNKTACNNSPYIRIDPRGLMVTACTIITNQHRLNDKPII